MSVSLCLAVHALPAETVASVLAALVELNVEIYRQGVATRSPFDLRWVPDELAEVSTMRDAKLLEDRGYGSCGELAAAYAAWLVVHADGEGELDLLSNGVQQWHVVARIGDRVFDPQHLGKDVGWHSHAQQR